MGSGFKHLCLCGGMYMGGWMVVLGVSGLEIRCPLTDDLQNGLHNRPGTHQGFECNQN